ncbi:hypothetical protein LZ518_05105 [Sphingomonas sp. RB56-2]|uniref:Phosphotyrosine protein phosphatase I domain-containing protein n=1 Tax=Sphingomonas brevis TaxID=2908206 RepID=A0ABT0S7Z2_9SPHN|nr:hypothetical protein [Sphingomonas brevis]MCL6740508.1 hypothetical protein [Sphingomonas brevis]
MISMDRRFLLVGAISVALLPQIAKGAAHGRSPRILFVCQFGTVKSPIARELLKRRAAERRIAIAVSARGITPEEHLPPELLHRLAQEGIDPASEPLTKLQPSDIAAADLVVAFDKLPSEYHPRRFKDWSDLPSMLNDYGHARSMLDARIDKLLDGLIGR